MENEEKYTTIQIPNCGLSREETEVEYKLAHLILEDVIFCNNGWWMTKKGEPWQDDYITHHVNCNDVFGWGCADSEDITHGEIHEFYHDFWQKDPSWGPAVWCIRKRKLMPQPPVAKILKDRGYNLDELVGGDNESSGS